MRPHNCKPAHVPQAVSDVREGAGAEVGQFSADEDAISVEAISLDAMSVDGSPRSELHDDFQGADTKVPFSLKDLQ
jgi:hypothetical protein